MKGYFGGKEVLKVLLGNSVIYSKKGGEVLPPPETIVVSRSSFLNQFISYSGDPVEGTTYNRNALMTDWVAVRPNSSYLINTYFSNTCVIQVKDASGTITNLTQFSGLKSVNGVVFPTGDNVFVRIYFYIGASGSAARDLSLTEQRE